MDLHHNYKHTISESLHSSGPAVGLRPSATIPTDRYKYIDTPSHNI